MILFEQVTKRFHGGIDALSDLTLAFEAGELAVLAGHSGAGKSTLLKMIPAILRPTHGSVIVNGQNVSALGRTAIPFLRRKIGMVFQDQKLLNDRNALENVQLPLAITGMPPREAVRRARAALDKVGLLERERALPVALSGGEQQRLAIARAVVGRPSVLLADEPTAHLDEACAGEIAALFNAFKQVGVTVLVATHHGALFVPYMTRRIDLVKGRLA